MSQPKHSVAVHNIISCQCWFEFNLVYERKVV